jgi:two-component system OmpR family sensor kinase
VKNRSIFVAITIIFAAAAISIAAAAIFFIEFDKDYYSKELQRRYHAVSKAIFMQYAFSPKSSAIQNQLDTFNFEWVKDKKVIKNVFNEGLIINKQIYTLSATTIINYDNHFYLYLENVGANILIKDQSFKPYRYQILITIFIAIFFAVLFAYIATINRLRPIKKIVAEVKKMGEGNFDINCNIDSSDEIGELARALDESTSKIQVLMKSRTVFLRNIMHELKTPITKGRLSTEMLSDSTQKQRLKSVFERLDEMVNEFAAIEKLSSGQDILEIQTYRVVDILDEAMDIAMVNRELVEINVDDVMISVDFKLFSIALKNLIDNAIKHSSDKLVFIEATTQGIQIKNRGKMLDHELSYYIEPFVKGEGSGGSFGLGLYIVDYIINAHGYKLRYSFDGEFNVFEITTVCLLKS